MLLSLMAGCATGIGSAIAFFAKKTNAKFLSFSLGLSAGVMIYISFMELLFSSRQQLEVITESTTRGSLITALAFFGGIFIAGLIDKFIPDTENPHELHSVEEIGGVPNPEHTHRLRRMGIVTALAIAVHNFPEGIATFISALDSAKVGIAVAAPLRCIIYRRASPCPFRFISLREAGRRRSGTPSRRGWPNRSGRYSPIFC